MANKRTLRPVFFPVSCSTWLSPFLYAQAGSTRQLSHMINKIKKKKIWHTPAHCGSNQAFKSAALKPTSKELCNHNSCFSCLFKNDIQVKGEFAISFIGIKTLICTQKRVTLINTLKPVKRGEAGTDGPHKAPSVQKSIVRAPNTDLDAHFINPVPSFQA